jgi:hypothetical protein
MVSTGHGLRKTILWCQTSPEILSRPTKQQYLLLCSELRLYGQCAPLQADHRVGSFEPVWSPGFGPTSSGRCPV